VTGLSESQNNLKESMKKRIKKLVKQRRRMRMWGAAGALCAVLAGAPPAYFLATGNMPALSFDGAIFISGDWAVVIGMIAVGLFGSMLCYSQFKRDKDKFDKIRAGAVELMQAGAPICECKWTPCSCKDNLAAEMSEKFDINLFY
jgi:hypothetical protein